MNIKNEEFAIIVIDECVESAHARREIMESPSAYENYLNQEIICDEDGELNARLFGENWKDPNKKNIDLLEWWEKKIFPKLEVFDGVTKEGFEKVPNNVNSYLEYLYNLKKQFKKGNDTEGAPSTFSDGVEGLSTYSFAGLEVFCSEQVPYEIRSIKFNNREIYKKEKKVRSGDWQVLCSLVVGQGDIVKRIDLSRVLKGTSYDYAEGTDDELNSSISRLKKYLHVQIKTEIGVGYKLLPEQTLQKKS